MAPRSFWKLPSFYKKTKDRSSAPARKTPPPIELDSGVDPATLEEFFPPHLLQRSPVHPGVILRDTLLPALHITTREMALRLRITRQTLHRILAGTTPISPQIALRLGRFCATGPEIWLRMQQNHDLWQAERQMRLELAQITPYQPPAYAASMQPPSTSPDTIVDIDMDLDTGMDPHADLELADVADADIPPDRHAEPPA